MTDSEFSDFFNSVLAGLPNYARNSIINYWADNEVSYTIVVSDDAVNRMEEAHKQIFESAITSCWEHKWEFAFRDFLRDAPPKILRTIIQHELIHAFLCPFLHPLKEQKPLSKLAVKKFYEFEALLTKLLADPTIKDDATPYEEKFVLLIQELFHGDEKTANEWVRLNAPKRS